MTNVLTTGSCTADEYDLSCGAGADLGTQQLTLLSALLDPTTRTVLRSLQPKENARYLEVGAGNGSIAEMMAADFGGSVLAVDKNVTNLVASPDVAVVHQDVHNGIPIGPFDLIHARLVLAHLPARRRVFAQLVEQLAPGGWLVIGDVGVAAELLVAPEESDHAVWRRYNHAAYQRFGPEVDCDYGWADRTEVEMFGAGLADVAAQHLVPLARGGGPWTSYHLNLSLQNEEGLLATGLRREDLDRYRTMLTDPEFRARFFSLTYTTGRKPSA